MKVAVVKETRSGESRVALVPQGVKALVKSGLEVVVERGAGTSAGVSDEDYREAGATIANDASEALSGARMLVHINPPSIAAPDELAGLQRGAVLVSFLNPLGDPALVRRLAESGITAISMELVPRITRAQSMDALSSQATVAGYKAVLTAAGHLPKFLPMFTTAAGTIRPAKALVLGAGVAGLQAIATARRLGAVVEAFDVRPASKEQVESLGAKFVDVPVPEEEKRQAETAGGYAREMSDDYKQRQAALIDERARAADIIVTTALIPGRPAPVLVREETVKGMKPGSVIVDLAVEQGGNCPLTERDQVVIRHGVHLMGYSNLPALLAADASALYARNLLHFVNLIADPDTGALRLDRADEIVAGALVCIDGAPVRTTEASPA